jgi:serine protease Do
MKGLFILLFAFCLLHSACIIPCRAQSDASNGLAAREQAALRAAADRIAESVVQIRTIGGLDAIGESILAAGPTTGLVISADGYIVSSAFNFTQQPASILVMLANGRQLPAELVSTDHSRMIVLLKAAGVGDLPVPEHVPAEDIRIGQWAVAVGRTFRSDRTNVSVGIVSALDRMFGKVFQTDADVSTANYGGPLVDIRGRVMGVIVPMAPQGASEVAGVEWYDSGIGFAVPIEAIYQRLEQMKQGKDQHAGILGIGLSPRNPHSAMAELAAVRPDSPAGKAGLRKGDLVVAIDGRTIRTQTDLRFALGTRYGGDSVRLVVERDEKRIERTIALVGELPAFRHAFLGILPLRSAIEPANDGADGENDDQAGSENESAAQSAEDHAANEAGISVRMVFPGSPAESAGVQQGDRIVKINDVVVNSIDAALSEMNNVAPESDVVIHLKRDDEGRDLSITTTRLSSNVPEDVPSAFPPVDGAAGRESTEDGEDSGDGGSATNQAPVAGSPARPEGQTRELKLPEFSQQCKIYVPAADAAGRTLGLLLWLHSPGEADAEAVIRNWEAICDRDGLLLAVPTASDANRWERTEMEYLGRLTKQVLAQYDVDPRRVAVYGERGGGSMAWLLGLSGREVFRGLATSSVPLPRQIRVPANEPGQRLAIFSVIPRSNDNAVQIAQGLQKCADAGYPVTSITSTDAAGELSSADREELARWIDTLDRF